MSGHEKALSKIQAAAMLFGNLETGGLMLLRMWCGLPCRLLQCITGSFALAPLRPSGLAIAPELP